MPYILSPEQKVVVDALLRDETSSTKYFDITTALQTICKGCTSVLESGKKILIHAPDENSKNLLNSMFSENGLDDLTIDLSSKQAMPEVDIIKLRSTLKKQKDTDAIIKYVLSNKKMLSTQANFTNFYSAFDSKVMADTRFRDFANSSIYAKNIEKVNLSIGGGFENQLEFSATEFYKAKKEIGRAAQIYDRQFDLFDHLSLFNSEIWNGLTEKRIQEIKNQLNDFKVESNQLFEDFVALQNNLTDNTAKELNVTFETLERKFQLHEEAAIAYRIKSEVSNNVREGVFSMFKKKKQQVTNKIYVEAFDDLSTLIQSISQKWYNELDAPTTEMITYEYIIEFIEKNKAKSNDFKSEISKNLKLSVQRINKINTSSEEVIVLDKRLEGLILKMNESEIFDLDIEHNILSFLKQSELSKNITDYIEKCHVLLNSSTLYLEWKSFQNSSGGIFDHLYDAIKRLPKNQWVAGFEQWYEGQIVKHVLGSMNISSSKLDDFYVQAKQSTQSEVASLIANLHPTRIESTERLKQTTKELHNTLFKKKQLPNVSWTNTALMNRSFMQSFFPIHISDSLSHSSEYDLVISLASNENSDKTNIHSFSPIQSKDIQNISTKKANFLYLNDYNYRNPLGQLSSTDKLKASKKLAKYILSLNQNIKIYQLKNANIISLLPTYDDSKLENELDALNVKVIDTNGVLYDRLTESILFTERKPYLIIKDELINSELHEHMLWQLKLKHLFQQVGYEILSLNTTDQLIDNQAQFDKIMQKIGGLKTNMPSDNLQKSEELNTVTEEV